jgi:hypothetical protein
MKRPMLRVVLGYGGGLIVGEFFRAPLAFLFTFAFLVLILTLALPRARGWLLYLLLFVAGWTNLCWRTAIVSPLDLRTVYPSPVAPRPVEVRGHLTATPSQRTFLRGEEEKFRSIAILERELAFPPTNTWQCAFGKILVQRRYSAIGVGCRAGRLDLRRVA